MADTSILVKPGRGSILNDPKARSLFYQALLAAIVIAILYGAYSNTSRHMADSHIPTGFSFWNAVAGFDINQTLIPYTQLSTYGQAFWVGLLNTLLVAVLGIVLTTIIGFTVGIARLSPNWIVAKVATVYVEVLRNIPLLLQLLFWYNAVLKPLPNPKQSIQIPGGIFLNNRGIIVPDPQFGPGSGWVGLALLAGVAGKLRVLRLGVDPAEENRPAGAPCWLSPPP